MAAVSDTAADSLLVAGDGVVVAIVAVVVVVVTAAGGDDDDDVTDGAIGPTPMWMAVAASLSSSLLPLLVLAALELSP